MQPLQTTRRSALSLLGMTLAASAAYGNPLRRSLHAHNAAFLKAVMAGDLESVERMLVDDAKLATSADSRGRSAFVLAHLVGHKQVASAIQTHMQDFDLVETILAKNWKGMEAILEADPELVNALHPIGGAALWAGARTGSGQLYLIRGFGAEHDGIHPKGSGTSPARAAMDCPSLTHALRGATDMLSNGGSVNHPQRDGDSVLHGAVRRRDLRLIRLALRKHASVSAKDAQGRTALDLARKLEFREGTALLEHPDQVARDYRASRFAWNASFEPIEWIDLSDVSKKRQSEVTSASHMKMKRIQAFLKEDPRLIFAISTDDELAIEACAHVGNAPIMQLHLDHGAPLSLPTAVSMGNLEAIEWMLEQDEQLLHERGAHDFPLMWYVVMGTGSPEVAACLHSYGVDLDQESVGTTLLHHCARRGRTELVKWLIENGASLEALSYSGDEAGQTALQLARIHEQGAVVQLLKAAGAPG